MAIKDSSINTGQKTRIVRLPRYNLLISVGILILLVLTLTVLNPDFFNTTTLINLMQQMPALGMVALGAMVVIISGGIDFTSGYGLAMIAMLTGTVTRHTSSFLLFILTFLIGGIILGLTNALIITKLKILPFIATFAVMSLAQGLSLFINGGNMVLLKHRLVRFAGHGRIAGIPAIFIIYLTACVIVYFLMNNTRFGTYTYAIGSNEEASRNTGININRYKILIYVFAGVCTAIASFITVSKIGMATPSITGSILIDGIAATSIGGTSMAGGKGNVTGTIIGTIIIVLISTALTYLNIPADYQDIFKGGVILIAVTIDAFVSKTVFKD